MDADAERRIIQILLTRQNRWWSGEIPEALPFRRRDFGYLMESLYKPRATVLIGPRQIGKTTLIKQMIHELLTVKKIEPKRILYVQLDDVELQLLSKDVMLDVLDAYRKNILLEDINLIGNDVFLFFDEVQRVGNWADILKTYHGISKNLHIFATGSAGFSISQKGKETLPGRADIYTMYPMKFTDALLLYHSSRQEHGKPASRGLDAAAQLGTTQAKLLRDSLVRSLQAGSFSEFYATCQKTYADLLQYEAELQAGVRRYLSKGGYPEIITEDSIGECQRLLRSYANDIIVKDLMPWFNIRDFPTAEKLMFLLASVSGEQINKQELLKHIGGSNYFTITKYIEYLENVFIVGSLPAYTGSRLGSTKHPKIYYHDTGLRNAILGILDSPVLELEKGHLAETAAFGHLLRLAYKLNESTPGGITFSSNPSGEVDFIVDLARYGTKLSIEIKFRRRIEEHKGTRDFISEHKNAMGMIVTESLLDYRDGIVLIPLWMLLSLC